MTNPTTLISTPFANSGTKNTIPDSGASAPQLATMEAGFPTITQTPINEGGVPPERADFNGLGNLVTDHLAFLNKGNWYEFDEAFAAKIGGYPLNARLRLDSGNIVQSTIPNNSNNPNSNMSGWIKPKVSADSVIDNNGMNQQQLNDIVLKEFNVLAYGADPTGSTSSHDAFVSCAKALSDYGSGRFVVPCGSYVVGKQTKLDSSTWRQYAETVVDLQELDSIVIDLQGCKIKNKDGIYYGQFDVNMNPITAQWSVPSRCSGGMMFKLTGNKSVSIIGSADIDGNLTNATIGGNYGDFGIQIEYYGFYAQGNTSLCNDAVLNIHDFGLDGYYVGARYVNKAGVLIEATDASILPYAAIKNVTSNLNARQGLSFGGGSGVIEDCHFEKIGKGRLTETLPRAGLDLESESGVIRDIKIIRTTMIDCAGIGLVNTSGVVRRDSYLDCKFIGSTNYSLYSTSGLYERCQLVGRVGVGSTSETFKERFSVPTFNDCIFSSQSIDAHGFPVYGRSFLLEPALAAKSYAVFNGCKFYAADGFIFAGANAAFTFINCKFYVSSENTATGLRSQFLNCTLINCEFIDLRESPVNTLQIGRNNNDPSVIWNNVSITSNTGRLVFNFASGIGVVSERQQDIFAKNSLVLANNQATIVTSQTSRTGSIAIYSKSVLPTSPTDSGNPFYAGDIIENWAVDSNSWTEARCVRAGYSCSTSWAASTAYSLNQYVAANNRVYQATVAGTSGTVAPSHTSGTATDGTVTWNFIGNLVAFRQYGARSAVTNAAGSDDTATKLNALIAALRANGSIQ